MANSLPKKLQAVLWSSAIESLDKERDKPYIIHQIFSNGRMDDILWLLQTYSESEIKKVFLHHTYKDYDAARFHFKKYGYLADGTGLALQIAHREIMWISFFS